MPYPALARGSREIVRALRPCHRLLHSWQTLQFSTQITPEACQAEDQSSLSTCPAAASSQPSPSKLKTAEGPTPQAPHKTVPPIDAGPRIPGSPSMLLQRPTEPDPDECCGRGCAECVWTTFWDDLKAHENAIADLQGVERPVDPFEEFERRLAEKEAHPKGAT